MQKRAFFAYRPTGKPSSATPSPPLSARFQRSRHRSFGRNYSASCYTCSRFPRDRGARFYRVRAHFFVVGQSPVPVALVHTTIFKKQQQYILLCGPDANVPAAIRTVVMFTERFRTRGERTPDATIERKRRSYGIFFRKKSTRDGEIRYFTRRISRFSERFHRYLKTVLPKREFRAHQCTSRTA